MEVKGYVIRNRGGVWAMSVADIDIAGVSLPRAEDLEKLSRKERCLEMETEIDRKGGPAGNAQPGGYLGYWTCSPSPSTQGEIQICNYHGDIIKSHPVAGTEPGSPSMLGIRPIVELRDAEALKLHKGDRFGFTADGKNYECLLIDDDGRGLCESCVDNIPYKECYWDDDHVWLTLANRNGKSIPLSYAVDYRHSDARKFLEDWAVKNCLLREDELDRRVLADSMILVSPDGTGDIQTLELPPFYLVESHKEDFDKYDWAQPYYQRMETAARTVLEAFKDGSLSRAGMVQFGKEEDLDRYYIDLCIRSEKLPAETWEKLKAVIPSDPCLYSGTYPAVNLRMQTYRETYGTVGRSWENNLVTGLTTAGASDVAEERFRHGEYAAGLRIFHLYNEKDPIAVERYAPEPYSAEWFTVRGTDVSGLEWEDFDTMDGNYAILQLMEFRPTKISKEYVEAENGMKAVWSVEFPNEAMIRFVEGENSVEEIYKLALEQNLPPEPEQEIPLADDDWEL